MNESSGEAIQKREPDKRKPAHLSNDLKVFPIIGIGASAGGLSAFDQFFAHLPAEPASQIAFVLIQHLDPSHPSNLVQLVQKYTPMKVVEAEEGVKVQQNYVYVIPPNKDITINHGKLLLTSPQRKKGLRLPIDSFFQTLAQDQRELAIGIILSGAGGDGTLGVKALKGENGMVMVQTPETAAYDSMPRSAIATKLVDYVLPPSEMPQQLMAYVQHLFDHIGTLGELPKLHANGKLQNILQMLRTRTGNDFSYYKQTTISRRIERRLAVNMIGRLEDYVRYVEKNPGELDALLRDLLIGVTGFFRDPEAFEALKSKAILPILKRHLQNEPVRIWVPGCASGEEAYSIALLCIESMDEQNVDLGIQIFATDIDRESIEKARSAAFPESIASDISSERLERFFIHQDNSFIIRKVIRDMVVFAEQNVIEDPPFSRLDLISCRNLLIYLEAETQKRLVSKFHYALAEQGYLFLGNSENIAGHSDLFTSIDKKWKLYQWKGNKASRTAPFDYLSRSPFDSDIISQAFKKTPKPQAPAYRELVEAFLLSEYTPACVVVNENFDIVYIHGHTGPYLEPSPGEATLNLLPMVREDFRLELAVLLRRAISQKEQVHLDRVQVKLNGGTRLINVIVKPVMRPEAGQDLFMVVFQDVLLEEPSISSKANEAEPPDLMVVELRRDLKAREEHLQLTVEELETVNQELKSSNEELQASNEELQSTNEEMESSKEELQSVNEELVTVNTELQKKLEELSQAQDDMKNMLAATGIGTLFLDAQLNIRSFTPATTKILKLIQSDIGRPVSDIVLDLEYTNLVQDAKQVLDTLAPKEFDVRARNGTWYSVRIAPYRTTENVIEGVVITFVDISQQKQTQTEMNELVQTVEDASELAEGILATVRAPMVVLNKGLKVILANRSFYQFFQLEQDKTVGHTFNLLSRKQRDVPELDKIIKSALSKKTGLENYRVEIESEKIGRRVMRLNAHSILLEPGKEQLILLAFEDITPPDATT
jgi:two-component system CheB/CheR fusion protein